MTPFELTDAMKRLNLSNHDVSFISGAGVRAVQQWRAGKNPIPRSLAVLLSSAIKGWIEIEKINDEAALIVRNGK